MKYKLLLSFVAIATIGSLHAQKNQKVTAFAITGAQKGNTNWSEVRLVDLGSGNEMQAVYTKQLAPELLNARTGKAIAKQETVTSLSPVAGKAETLIQSMPKLDPVQLTSGNTTIIKEENGHKITIISRNSNTETPDKPFATKSAALAYDKKHERLYYTPMGINQLRYIDLKSKSSKIYYFENESFGTVKGSYDIANQITRMVIASDGNGYALSNDANHLIQFTTNKKATITDLGAVSDDGVNAISIHKQTLFGGDMVADTKGNLYLIAANNKVYKINIETKLATYLGVIRGLPAGYTTNGAAVEGGTKLVVCSSNSTEGYYRVDINGLRAEKLEGGNVFNASDLANGNLLTFAEEKEEQKEVQVVPTENKPDIAQRNAISVFPNPVTDGLVKIAFDQQPAGRYNVQVLENSGKVIQTQAVTINAKAQVVELRLPAMLAKGNYIVRVADEAGEHASVTKLLVQ